MIINHNKGLRSKRAPSCLAREAFARLGRVRSDRVSLPDVSPRPGGAVPTRFHIEPAARPDDGYCAAVASGPSRSSEGYKLYYLVRWLD